MSLFYSRWVWAEGGQFPDLEAKLGIGGFGYPVRYQNETLVVYLTPLSLFPGHGDGQHASEGLLHPAGGV